MSVPIAISTPSALHKRLPSHGSGHVIKQVRFSSIALAHDPPNSKAPTLSIDSLSVAPPDSLQDVHQETLKVEPTHRRRKAPSPSRFPRTRLHRYLAAFERPTIDYDLRDDPLMVASRHGRLISSKSLAEPATDPPTVAMYIHCQYFLRSWGTLQIAPQNAVSSPFITVADVLTQIYAFLRKNLTSEDYSTLSKADQREAIVAYEARYRRFKGSAWGDMYEKEKKGGMKRVDFLQTHSRFIGLSSPLEGSSRDVWILGTG